MNATQSSAAASGGVAGAAVVLAVWALSLTKVQVPADAVAALTVLFTVGFHYVALRMGGAAAEVLDGTEPAKPAPTPAPEAPKA